MAKAIPGVGRSRGKESVEEGGKERDQYSLGYMEKPIKPFHKTCTAHEGAGCPLEEVLKAWAGK